MYLLKKQTQDIEDYNEGYKANQVTWELDELCRRAFPFIRI
jgi:hypothetical protein